MLKDVAARHRRELVVAAFLTSLLCAGTLLFLVVVSGWFVVSALIALSIMLILSGVQYLLWGRTMPSFGPIDVDHHEIDSWHLN
jgi:hypothetical protein